MPPVPGFKLSATHHALHICAFLLRLGKRWTPHTKQKILHTLGCFCHVVFENVVGVRVVAHQRRPFSAQLGDFHCDRAVVILPL